MTAMNQNTVGQITRRALLARSTYGIGSLALASLLNPSLLLGDSAGTGTNLISQRWPGVVSPLHFAPKARRVIHLCMAGGPSHLETLDYKPKLAEMSGKPMPESFTKG